VKILCDGSGNGSAAMVVYNSKGRKIYSRVKHSVAKTNNEAEYHAMIMSLEYAASHGGAAIITTDSQLIYNQLKGLYQVKAENLLELHRKASSILNSNPRITIQWKPRVHVSEADELMR